MGCSQPCETIPPLLEDPTENEEMLWRFATRQCVEFDDPCRVLPSLDNPTGCESALLAYLKDFSSCRISKGCAAIPSFPPDLDCPPNLVNITDFTERQRVKDAGEGGDDGGATPGPPLPLTLACQVPDADCAVDCSGAGPDINVKANGGVLPYIWSLTPSVAGNIEPNTSEILGSPTPVVNLILSAKTDSCSAECGSTAFNYYPCDCDGTLIPLSLVCSAGGNCQVRIHHLPGKCDGTFGSPTDSCGGGTSSCLPTGTCGPTTASSGGCPVGFCFCGSCSPNCQAFSGCESPTSIIGGTSVLCAGICVAFAAARGGCGAIHDVRTAAAKAEGCAPCCLQFQSLVVTVTDAVGSSASVTLTCEQLPQNNTLPCTTC